MSSKYKDNYIWFSIPGGVAGFTLEEINSIIKKWNDETFQLYKYGTFIDFLQYETGKTIYRFSALWNNKNPLLNKLYKIKGTVSD